MASNQWRLGSLLRIAIDGQTSASSKQKYAGFTEITHTSTLRDVRNQIVKELGPAIPLNFIFVLPDGVPVSVVQEESLSASSFTPTVTLRGVDKPVLVGSGSDDDSKQGGRGRKIAVRMSEQVARAAGYSQGRPRQGDGLVFHQWLTPQYTFGQLKRDAARFWGLPPSDVVLDDGDGCLWPDEACVVVVEQMLKASPTVTMSFRPALSTLAKVSRSAQKSGRSIASGSEQKRGDEGHGQGLGQDEYDRSEYHDQEEEDGELQPIVDFDCEMELWNIFTYYCVTGDANELCRMRSKAFLRLLRDCGIVCSPQKGGHTHSPAISGTKTLEEHGGLTPAVCAIIYAQHTQHGAKMPRQEKTMGRRSQVKGVGRGKMDYFHFLDALMEIAYRISLYKQNAKPGTSALSPASVEKTYSDLLTRSIFPFALRWPAHRWFRRSQQIRSRGVFRILNRFYTPLALLFKFYGSKEHEKEINTRKKHSRVDAYRFKSYSNDKDAMVLGQVDIDSLVIFHEDFIKLTNDFGIVDCGLSRKKLSELFLASSFFDEIPIKRASTTRTELDEVMEASALDAESLSKIGAEIAKEAMQGAHSAHASADDGDGDGTIFEPEMSMPSPKLYRYNPYIKFPQFLELLVRIALAAYDTHQDLDAVDYRVPVVLALKCVFQKIARKFRDARHGTHASHPIRDISSHPGYYINGMTRFSKEFVTMWKEDGSCDYLSDCKITPTIEYSFKRGIRFHHFSPGFVAAGVHQGLDQENVGESLDLADTHHNTVFDSGSTLLTRLSVRVKRKSERVPVQLSAMAVSENAAPRLQTATGQTTSPINAQGFDERGVHVQMDGYRPVLKVGARRASWLAPPAAGAIGGPAAEAGDTSLGGANREVESAPSPVKARGTNYASLEHTGIDVHERKQRSVSESTWNSSNGEANESVGDTAVSRTSTLTSMKGGFATATGPVSEQQKEGQRAESLAGTAGNTATTAEKAGEEEQEAKAKEMRHILMRGSIFKKYGKYGNPHRRYVWVSDNMEDILWQALHKKKAAECLKASEVTSCVPGRNTAIFDRYKSSEDEKRCSFSLIAARRTLDLEADSESTRNKWVEALNWLIKYKTQG